MRSVMGNFKIISIIIIVLIVVFYALSFVTGSSKGLSWVTSLNNETKSTKAVNVQMAGYDGRAYERVCPKNPEYMCGAITTSEGVGGYSYPISTK